MNPNYWVWEIPTFFYVSSSPKRHYHVVEPLCVKRQIHQFGQKWKFSKKICILQKVSNILSIMGKYGS
jgi:hypothetical protein